MNRLTTRLAKLEAQDTSTNRQVNIHRTIVSIGPGGKLQERLAFIRNAGGLFRRKSDETNEEFVTRAESKFEEQDQ